MTPSDTLLGLLRSKVFYFNVVTIGLEIANAFPQVLPPGTLVIVNAVGNILLRTITTGSLAEKMHRPEASSTIIEFTDPPDKS